MAIANDRQAAYQERAWVYAPAPGKKGGDAIGIQAMLWLLAFKSGADFVPHLRATLYRLKDSYKEDLKHLDPNAPEYSEARYLADLIGALALATEQEEQAFDLDRDLPPGC